MVLVLVMVVMASKFNLFNSHRIDAIDITSKTLKMSAVLRRKYDDLFESYFSVIGLSQRRSLGTS